MRLLQRFRNTKTLHKYILSYFLILIVPLFIFILFMNSSYLTVLRKQVFATNESSVSKVVEQVDGMFEEMHAMIYRMAKEPALSPNMQKNGLYSPSDVARILEQYASGQGFIHEILYYIEGETKVYGSSNNGDLESLGNAVYPFEDWRAGKITENLAQTDLPLMKPSETVRTASGAERELIRYTYPMDDLDPKVTFVILIDGAALRKTLAMTDSFFTDNFYILNESNEILLAQNKKESISSAELDEVVKQAGEGRLSTQKIKGTSYYAVVSKMPLSSRKYVAVVDKQNIDRSLTPVIVTAYVCGSLIVVLGGIIIWFAMGITYRPIKHLISEVRKESGDTEFSKDDIAYIKSVIDRYFIENKDMERTLEEHKPIIKNYVINELIKGRQEDVEELYEAGQLAAEAKQGIFYFVAIISFPNESPEEMQELKQLIMAREQEGIELEYFDVSNNAEAVCVFCETGAQESSLEYLEKLRAHISQATGCVAAFAVGSSYRDFFQIGQSYFEADTIKKRESFLGPSQVARFEQKDGGEIDYAEYARYYKLVNNLSLQLDNKNIEAVKFSVERIINTIAVNHVPPFIKRCIIFEVFNTLIKVMMEYDVKTNGKHLISLEDLPLEDMNSADSLHSFLGKICIDVCDYICQGDNKEDAEMRRMNDFIDAHYKEDDFSLTKMADSLKVSVQYLCEHYKRNTGETIINRVFYKRMEEAKRLLAETDMPVKDIAREVGYIDTSNFGKRFKLRQGMTPKSYREMKKSGTGQENGGMA